MDIIRRYVLGKNSARHSEDALRWAITEIVAGADDKDKGDFRSF
jgi:hypothetical protein